MSDWSIATVGCCGPFSSDRTRSAPRSPWPSLPARLAERRDDLRHLGLDRLQRCDHLGDALAGDVLEAARLVDARGGVLQLARPARRSGAPPPRRAFRSFPGSRGRRRGVLDDRVQLVGGERDVADGDVVDAQARRSPPWRRRWCGRAPPPRPAGWFPARSDRRSWSLSTARTTSATISGSAPG